jgi:hypothetical protein
MRLHRHLFRALLAVALGVAALGRPGNALASFLDGTAALDEAISTLRPVLGDHPRVLKIEIDAKTVTIEAQDRRNPRHVDRWRCADRLLGVFPMRVSGPEPVDPTLLDPDLDANLFGLDTIDFAAAARLEKQAVARAALQDPAQIIRMEIARQVTILPQPKAGEVRWLVAISSGREHAEIFADPKGRIFGADLSGTRRAKSLDILQEPALAKEAAASFRSLVGAGPVLTAVAIEAKSVSFTTTIRDQAFGKMLPGMLATQSFTWNLDGLARRLGTIDVSAQTGTPGSPPFAVDDVDWTILAKLEADALARLALPKARIANLRVEKSSTALQGPALTWTVGITSPDDQRYSVIADVRGSILRVVLPEGLRPKIDWRDPAALAGAISRIGSIFGEKASIASIDADERGCRITLDDPVNGGKPATFEFSADGVTRATISFSLDSMGPRFPVSDLAPLTADRLASLEAQALFKLGERRKAYLESIRIGAHPFVPQAGAQAIEIRVRDAEIDSVSANYAWMVFDFEGRLLDSVTY